MLSFTTRSRLGVAIRLTVALGCGMLAAAREAALAITLDATSGTNTSSASLSTTGNLTINLGFFSEYLVVGGGGGGAGANLGDYGGGGGGGGLLTNVDGTPLQLGAGTFMVTVGAGGGAAESGQNSVFDTFTAVGGGGGGLHAVSSSALWPGDAGGSGGGGGGNGKDQNGAGGAGTAGQGSAGGRGFGSSTSTERASGGGGGAGGAGGNASAGVAGNGGDGRVNTITGAEVYYAGGGGGAARNGTPGTGGLGGGGAGGRSNAPLVAGVKGVDGLGGGGGGRGSSDDPTSGGSGVVIVRYQGSPAGTGGSVDPGTGTALGYTLHTFTTVGTTALDLSGLDLNERLGLTLTSGIDGDGDFTFDGPGRLTLAGANTYAGDTFINAGRLLATGSIGSSGTVFVAEGAGLGGTGSIGGNLSFAATSFFNVVDLADPLAVGGTVAFDTGETLFGIANLAGIDWDNLDLNTPYTLISTSQTTFDNLANFGFDNRTSVGSTGRQAYFEEGSLQVIVVPEPAGIALLAIAATGLAVCRLGRRRHTQQRAAA